MVNKKIKLVQKSDTLLLKVWCNDEHFSDCEYAVFELTDKVKKEINAMRSTMTLCIGRNQRDKDAPTSLYKMTYWMPENCRAEFLDNKNLPEKLLEEAEEKGDEILFLNKKPKLADMLRVDTSIMHIMEDGIIFETYIKNTSIQLETCSISFSELGL